MIIYPGMKKHFEAMKYFGVITIILFITNLLVGQEAQINNGLSAFQQE